MSKLVVNVYNENVAEFVATRDDEEVVFLGLEVPSNIKEMEVHPDALFDFNEQTSFFSNLYHDANPYKELSNESGLLAIEVNLPEFGQFYLATVDGMLYDFTPMSKPYNSIEVITPDARA